MQNERNDVWNPSFYNRAIRTKIGEALSRAKGYDLSQPLPDQIRVLLDQLDEPSVRT
jgi:hypothetical protein